MELNDKRCHSKNFVADVEYGTCCFVRMAESSPYGFSETLDRSVIALCTFPPQIPEAYPCLDYL